MNTKTLYTVKDDIPDTIAALVLMQKSLLSELNRKQSHLSLTESEAQYLRDQNKMLEQQIIVMMNMVRDFESPMN